jgi:hypothetical protein
MHHCIKLVQFRCHKGVFYSKNSEVRNVDLNVDKGVYLGVIVELKKKKISCILHVHLKYNLFGTFINEKTLIKLFMNANFIQINFLYEIRYDWKGQCRSNVRSLLSHIQE